MLVKASRWSLLGLVMLAAASAPAFAAGQDGAPALSATDPDPAGTLAQQLRNSVQVTQADPSIPDILAALDRNIAAVGRLRTSIDAANKNSGAIDADLIHSIASDFGVIARSFGDIAAMAPGVFQRRADALRDIDAIGSKIGFSAAKARASIKDLTRQNELIANALKNGNVSEAELTKMQLSKQVNEAVIKNLETAVESWAAFGAAHARLVAGLDAQSEQLDIFFHTLSENARLFDSAAKTMQLADSISGTLSELKSMQDAIATINDLQTRMIDSWQDVSKIIDEVDRSLSLKMSPGM